MIADYLIFIYFHQFSSLNHLLVLHRIHNLNFLTTMQNESITFEALPQLTSELQSEVKQLKETLETFMKKVLETVPEGTTKELVGVEEACSILGLKRPTVYHKAQTGELKSYKPKGCKMLLFKRSDLMEWVERSNKSIDAEAMLEQMRSKVRHKPKSGMGEY